MRPNHVRIFLRDLRPLPQQRLLMNRSAYDAIERYIRALESGIISAVLILAIRLLWYYL